MYKFVFFISTFNMQSTHTHTVHTPPTLHWKNRKNNKRNSRKNNELFSRKNTKILHFTFQYEIFIDFKDKLSNNMEMHLHNTGRRVWRGTGGRGSCQYEGERRKRDRERRRRRRQRAWQMDTKPKQENVIPAKRSKLPANTATDASLVLDTGNGHNWQQRMSGSWSLELAMLLLRLRLRLVLACVCRSEHMQGSRASLSPSLISPSHSSSKDCSIKILSNAIAEP